MFNVSAILEVIFWHKVCSAGMMTRHAWHKFRLVLTESHLAFSLSYDLKVVVGRQCRKQAAHILRKNCFGRPLELF